MKINKGTVLAVVQWLRELPDEAVAEVIRGVVRKPEGAGRAAVNRVAAMLEARLAAAEVYQEAREALGVDPETPPPPFVLTATLSAPASPDLTERLREMLASTTFLPILIQPPDPMFDVTKLWADFEDVGWEVDTGEGERFHVRLVHEETDQDIAVAAETAPEAIRALAGELAHTVMADGTARHEVRSKILDWFWSLASMPAAVLGTPHSIERESLVRMEVWDALAHRIGDERCVVAYRKAVLKAHESTSWPVAEYEVQRAEKEVGHDAEQAVADFMLDVWRLAVPYGTEVVRERVMDRLDQLFRLTEGEKTGAGVLGQADRRFVAEKMLPPVFPMPYADVRRIASIYRVAVALPLLRKVEMTMADLNEGRLLPQQVEQFAKVLTEPSQMFEKGLRVPLGGGPIHGLDCPGVVWGEVLALCAGGSADCPGAGAEREARAREEAVAGPSRRLAVLGGECSRCLRGGGAHEPRCVVVERFLQKAAADPGKVPSVGAFVEPFRRTDRADVLEISDAEYYIFMHGPMAGVPFRAPRAPTEAEMRDERTWARCCRRWTTKHPDAPTLSQVDALSEAYADDVIHRTHASHCCREHGCKYSSPSCPVVRGAVEQKAPCQDCEET